MNLLKTRVLMFILLAIALLNVSAQSQLAGGQQVFQAANYYPNALRFFAHLINRS